MKLKYPLLTLILSFSMTYLAAQEQDTTATDNQGETESVIKTDEDPQIQKKSDGIIITGPNGVIIDEPKEKYQINDNRTKFRFKDEDEELVTEGDDQEMEEMTDAETKGAEGPKIIYYESSEQQGDRYYHGSKRKSDIKTLAGSMNHSGGFGAVSFRYSDFRDESMVMAGFRGGWIVNRTLGIGFEGHGVIPTSRYEDIDDNRDVVLVGGYGGMFLELIFFSNQVIHVTFPVSAGAGWLGYTEHWENDFTNPPYSPDDSLFYGRNQLIDDDTFWYIEPGANIELNVSRNFRMCFGVSKRFTQDFNMLRTNDDAFDKPNYYLTLKFGRF
ncbi:MAG: hypothetical protein KI791_00205 [Cyclobacteriaceae bacterium]|nr:hypothetical protein [Cyclobacteriaceae bacterium SS2]